MKKGWIGYALLGAAFYLVFLLAAVPAAWFAWGLARATQGVVSLSAPVGSIWSGSGALVVHRAPEPPRQLGRVSWGVNPLWLVTGRLGLGAALEVAGGGEARGRVRLGVGSIVVRDLSASFAAQILPSLYSPAALLDPKGRVDVRAEELLLDRANVSGRAEINWQGAATSLSSVQPLGDYRLIFEGQGASAAVRLETLSGELDLNGAGQWQVQTGQLNFNGTAAARSRAEELGTLLRLMGPDQGGGRHAFSIQKVLLPGQ
ncbi:MAG TPA: type II secretion system protein N [Acidiferrobacterales bacterium]